MARPRKPQPRPVKTHARKRGQGSVVKAGPSSWRAFPPSINGVRDKPRTFRSEAEANTWLNGLLSGAESAPLADAPNQLLLTYLERWAQSKIVREQSRPLIQRSVRYAEPLWRTPLNQLTHRDFQQLFASLLKSSPSHPKRGLAITSVAQIRKALGNAMRLAVPDLIPYNPVERATLPAPEKKDVAYWEEPNVRRFLAFAYHSPLYAFFRMAIGTGARPGELRALRWEHLDLEKRIVLIRQGMTVAGKLTVQQTKTSRWRDVEVPRESVAALQQYRRQQARVSPWVFCNDTGEPLSEYRVDKEFKRLVRLSAVPVIRLYDCRHTFATTSLDRGVPLSQVSAALGHADTSITAKVYWRHLKSQRHLVTDAIEAAFPETFGVVPDDLHFNLHGEEPIREQNGPH